MNIKLVIDKLIALKYDLDYFDEPETLHDKILHRYLIVITARLDSILDEHKKIIKKLGYTLEVDESSPDRKALESSKNSLIADLKKFLEDNWDLTKSTLLGPTALLHPACLDILSAISLLVSEDTGVSPIECLMPGVITDSLVNAETDVRYPDLTVLDMRVVLKTHILSQAGGSLIPVNLLGYPRYEDISEAQYDLDVPDLDSDTDASIAAVDLAVMTRINASGEMYKPYYNFGNKEETPYVNPEELARLYGHSEFTEAIRVAEEKYNALKKQDSSLLVQLERLCRELGINSVKGAGSDEEAAAGAYPPIINFIAYYQQLAPINLSRIPEDLKEEIDTLISLSTDAERNIHATEQLETCIDTRRSALMRRIQGSEALLSQIALEASVQQSAIQQAKRELEEAQSALRNALLERRYLQGSDRLKITIELLNKLSIPLKIESHQELVIFKDLSAGEMRDLLKDEGFLQSTLQQLQAGDEYLSELVMLMLGLSAEKVEIFFSAAMDSLMEEGVFSLEQDLGALLSSLDDEKIVAIVKVIKLKAPGLLIDLWPYTLSEVMDVLSLSQRRIIYNELAPYLIQKKYFFRIMRFKLPSDADYELVYDIVQDKVPDFVTSPEKLSLILSKISRAKGQMLCDTMKERDLETATLADRPPALLVAAHSRQRKKSKKISKASDYDHDDVSLVTDLSSIAGHSGQAHGVSAEPGSPNSLQAKWH